MTTKRLWPEVADSLKLTRDLYHDFKPLCHFLPTASLYLPSSSEQGTVSVLYIPVCMSRLENLSNNKIPVLKTAKCKVRERKNSFVIKLEIQED